MMRSLLQFMFAHPLASPLTVLSVGGAGTVVLARTLLPGGHEGVILVHVGAVTLLGGAIVLAIFLLLKGLLGSLVATGKSFDTSASSLMAQNTLLATQIQRVGDRLAVQAGELLVLKDMADTQDRRIQAIEKKFVGR